MEKFLPLEKTFSAFYKCFLRNSIFPRKKTNEINKDFSRGKNEVNIFPEKKITRI